MRSIKRVFFLLISGALWLWDRGSGSGGKPRKRCVILYYHHVLPGEEDPFERQIKTLLLLGTPVRADWRGEGNSSGLHHMVTFDDGFIHTVRRVLPVLEHFKVPFTVFIPAAYMGKKAGWPGAGDGTDEDLVLSEGDLRTFLSKEIFMAGSHGMTHNPLTRLSDSRAYDEIVSSRMTLEKATGKPVMLFSFPHGEYRNEHIDMCKNAGYTRVFSIDPYLNFTEADAFVLGRVEVGPKDWMPEFKLKAMGCYRWTPWASRWKRRIFGAWKCS